MLDALYSERLLTLAANLPHAGRLDDPEACVAERTAKLCGSRVRVELVLAGGRVARFAQDVQACALGQASAGVLGEAVIGATPGEIDAARDALRAMLKSDGAPPEGRFAGLVALAPIAAYPARHASTLLAFEAAAEAAAVAARAAGGASASMRGWCAAPCAATNSSSRRCSARRAGSLRAVRSTPQRSCSSMDFGAAVGWR